MSRQRPCPSPSPIDSGSRRARTDRGMALIGVIVLSAFLMALAIAVTLAIRSDTQLRGAFGSGVTGFYAAESGLNVGMGTYRNIFLTHNVPTSSDFALKTLTTGSRTVNYQMSQRFFSTPCAAGCTDTGGSGKCVCQNITIPAGQLFSGLQSTEYQYTVISQAVNTNNDIEASVGANFLVGNIPLFQFVAFYRNDLEIAPGPQMNLQGRIHTNSNLYLSANSGPLTIEDNPAAGVLTVQVTAGQNVYRGRKYASDCTGTVSVAMLQDANNDGRLDQQALACNGTGTRQVPPAELATWKGSMFSNVGNISIPDPGIIKPPSVAGWVNQAAGSATPGDYWNNADLRIVLHARNGKLNDDPAVIGGARKCATTAPTVPYAIEVVDSSGASNAVKTAWLHRFMCDWAWNNTAGKSAYPGTMPIFVTDVPLPAVCPQGVTPPCNTATAAAAASYAPAIPNTRKYFGAAGAYGEVMAPNAATAFDLDYRRGGFFNWREKKWMLLLNINLSDLMLWNRENGGPFFDPWDSTDGGPVIYATIDGPNSSSASSNYGVRIFGSANLPCPSAAVCGIGQVADPLGVTVATDQAMYVLGNFNQGTANGGPPRQPASLIGDSINVMSQNYWAPNATCGGQACRDGQSTLVLTNAARNATATWVNAALLGGVDTTGANSGTQGTYNGGLENYPRFHENWSGITLTYQGSFVSLGTPTHVNGAWTGTGSPPDIYNPPTRAWNYDAAFNNAANLPPLTPTFVYVQQVLFTEDFK
jgi:hypothetical protein